jgi:glucokinase
LAKLWSRFGYWFGEPDLCSNAEVIVIGGGVSASSEFFFPSVQAEIERRVLPSSRAGLQLLVAELGNQAGMVGAAKLAWMKVDPPQPS